MKTRRPVSINNSLAHGICNASCSLCAVNKPGYAGPREYQPWAVTKKLIERVTAAGQAGTHVRYVANAGDGEPTLHPEFVARMNLFGSMIREWDASVPAPEVSVVTNGFRLDRPGILEAIAENSLSLIVSFPSAVPTSYGEVMVCHAKAGAPLLARVAGGISRAMALRAHGRLRRLLFHVSPPDRTIIRRDFPETVAFLAERARQAGLGEIDLVMFPATSNRTALVDNEPQVVDMYPDLFAAFDGRQVHGVRIRMRHVLSRFFASTMELADLVRSMSFPCIWNANLFVAADGTSICCNDQAVRRPQGNVMVQSLKELMEAKERFLPNDLCEVCDQSPLRMGGTPQAAVYAWCARSRYRAALMASTGKVVPLRDHVPAARTAGAER